MGLSFERLSVQADDERDFQEGWSNHLVRLTLGTNLVRGLVLKHVVDSAVQVPTVNTFDSYPEFGSGSQPEAALNGYVDSVLASVDERRYVACFVTQWQQSRGDRGTHFVGLVFDTSDKTVQVFDPAYGNDQSDDSAPLYYFDLSTVKAHLETKGYTLSYNHGDATIQVSKDDIYCQSWSLFLVARHLHLNVLGLRASKTFPSSLPGKTKQMVRWRGLLTLVEKYENAPPAASLKEPVKSYVQYLSKKTLTRRETLSRDELQLEVRGDPDFLEYEESRQVKEDADAALAVLDRQIELDTDKKLVVIWGFLRYLLEHVDGVRAAVKAEQQALARSNSNDKLSDFDAVEVFLTTNNVVRLMRGP